MVDPIYVYARGLGLFFTFCGLIATTIQLYILQRSKDNVETKYYLHYCCFVCLFFNVFNFIDPDGVFSLLPFTFIAIAGTLSAESLGTGFCLIIYSHFHAHYLSMKKVNPPWLRLFLTFTMIANIIGNLFGVSLVYGLNKNVYFCLANVSSLLWIIFIVGADLYSYNLVRKLVLNGLETENKICSMSNEVPTPKESRPQPNPYHNLLNRMRIFHVICFLLSLVFFILQSIELLTSINSGNRPPIYANPNTFTFANAGYGFLYLILVYIFTWWAWVPLKKKEDDTKETFLSKSDLSHHKPSQQDPETRNEDNSSHKIEQGENGNPQLQIPHFRVTISPTETVEQHFEEGLEQDLYVT